MRIYDLPLVNIAEHDHPEVGEVWVAHVATSSWTVGVGKKEIATTYREDNALFLAHALEHYVSNEGPSVAERVSSLEQRLSALETRHAEEDADIAAMSSVASRDACCEEKGCHLCGTPGDELCERHAAPELY